MNTVDSFDILVIMLSLTLAVFLVLAIMLVLYLIRIAKQVSNITDKASKTADHIEAIGKAASSVGPLSFITNIVSSVVEKSMNEEGEDDE
jgi:cell division protein FtsL